MGQVLGLKGQKLATFFAVIGLLSVCPWRVQRIACVLLYLLLVFLLTGFATLYTCCKGYVFTPLKKWRPAFSKNEVSRFTVCILPNDLTRMQTPQTTPIAKYPTPTGTCTIPPSLLCGRSIISSNASLIAYCTKGGLIRVIDKQNGGKTLLRLHGTGDATAAVAASGRDERLGRSSLYDIR